MGRVAAFYEQFLPYDLGDDNHRWSWLVEVGGGKRNMLWGHFCSGRYVVCWIDLASGKKHRLVSAEPLELAPSVICPIGCGDHGFVRAGQWEPS